MKLIECGVAVLALLLLAAPLQAEPLQAAPVKLWETDGFKGPESALPVPAEGFAYVSNIAGKPSEKNSKGFISKVALDDGKIIELEWAKGLNAPKGLALVNGLLYAADIDQLVAIDTKTGKIAARYAAPSAKFLNDVAADGAGRVYVSDSATSTIWRLADGTFEKWLDSKELNNVNGLLAQGDKLIIAPWGKRREDGSAEPARLLEVSLKDKTIRPLGNGEPIGNLDGIEPLDDSTYLVTEFMGGGLYRVDASGAAKLVLDLDQRTADIGYVRASRTVLIPMLRKDKLLAYRLQ